MIYTNNQNNSEILRKKLYINSTQYQKFKNLKESDFIKIKNKIDKLFPDKHKSYIKVLKYLVNPYIYLEFPNYDDKILFLILAIDPNLNIYKQLISRNITSKNEINQATDEEEKEALKNTRKEELKDYINSIKQQFGFFDKELLSYERDLFKLLNKDKIQANIKINNIDKLLKNSQEIKNFDSITNDDYEKLNTIAQKWFKEAPNSKDYNSLAYNIINKNKILNLKSYQEQILLFIIISDPNLRILQIYEEESTYNNIKKRCLEDFNFYNKNIIHLEKKYQKKFCPNKKIRFLEP